jgi:glycosyltransferase involved in cell wall biosynthesis
VTAFLKSLYPTELQSRIHVVHDGIERPFTFKTEWNTGTVTHNKPLKTILVTSDQLDRLPVLTAPPSWLKVRIVGRYGHGLRRLQEIRWGYARQSRTDRMNYLRFLVNSRIKCIPWENEGVYHEMLQADIAIIPIEKEDTRLQSRKPAAWEVKSENRLTMKMSVGLPVIATPIPSYEPVIQHGVNGFFASSRHDWATCLSALRDPELRKEMGAAARYTVFKRYSMEEQAARLIDIIRADT